MKRLRKEDRLSSNKQIAKLVKNGHALHCYPFLILWDLSRNSQGSYLHMEAAFSVPKKKFKKAVQRNVIRRRMKEAYRLNKDSFSQQIHNIPYTLSLLFIFIPKKELAYLEINNGMSQAFGMLKNAIQYQTQQ